MVGHGCVFDNNEDLLDSVEDSKDMVCMTRTMDKVEETCDHELTPKQSVFSSNNLSMDLGGWINNVKVSVPVAESVKVLAQKDKPLKALVSSPQVSKVSDHFQNVLEEKTVGACQNESVFFQNVDSVYSGKDHVIFSFPENIKDRIKIKEVNKIWHEQFFDSVDFWQIFKDVRHYQSHKKQERVKRATNQVFLQKDKYLLS